VVQTKYKQTTLFFFIFDILGRQVHIDRWFAVKSCELPRTVNSCLQCLCNRTRYRINV